MHTLSFRWDKVDCHMSGSDIFQSLLLELDIYLKTPKHHVPNIKGSQSALNLCAKAVNTCVPVVS
jgi:hypothetical protein